MRRTAFYARISTNRKRQRYSLAKQVDLMTSYCRERYGDGWYLFKAYADEKSGKDMNRRGLQDMLDDADAKAFDELLVLRVDRLARNARAVVSILDALAADGIAFRSVTEPFDTSGPAGRMMLQVLGSFAELERNAVSERAKVSMLRKARDGRYPGSMAPYGYRIAGSNGLVVHRDEAAVVASIFRMYVCEGMGSPKIAHALNRSGVRSHSGGDWCSRVVRGMLKNPAYTGKMRWSGVRSGCHEPIVDEEAFLKAGEILRQRMDGRRSHRPRRVNDYLLSGILRCGRCGSLMRASGERGNSYFYYVCSRKRSSKGCHQENIRGDLLERSLTEEVRALFRDHDLMKRVHDVAKGILAPETLAIEEELAELESARKRIAGSLVEARAGFEKGEVTAATCSARARQLMRERGRLAQNRSRLARALASRKIAELDHAALAAAVGGFDKALTGNDGCLKKLWMRTFVAGLVVSGREFVKIWYRVPGPVDLPAGEERQRRSRAEWPEARFALCYRPSSCNCPERTVSVAAYVEGSSGSAPNRSVEITRADAPHTEPGIILGCGRAGRRHPPH